MMILLAWPLRYTGMLYLFLCVPLFGRWRRRSSTPIGRRACKRLRRCQPAVLQRAQRHHQTMSSVICACCLCIQLAWHMYYYGPLYGLLKFCVHRGHAVSMHAPTTSGMASSPCPVPHPPHSRWRGGAKSDLGTATGDASVYLEMFCAANNHILKTHARTLFLCDTMAPKPVAFAPKL